MSERHWQGCLFDVGPYEDLSLARPPMSDMTAHEAELWEALGCIEDDPLDPRVRFLSYKLLKMIERQED